MAQAYLYAIALGSNRRHGRYGGPAGVVTAVVLRMRRPEVYASIGRFRSAEPADGTPTEVPSEWVPGNPPLIPHPRAGEPAAWREPHPHAGEPAAWREPVGRQEPVGPREREPWGHDR